MRKSRKQQKNDRRRIVPITAKTINQKDYIRDIDNNPHNWNNEQADCMFLANMFAQRGSDKLLTKIGEDDLEAMKEAYYKFHHTAPDEATINRVDKIII